MANIGDIIDGRYKILEEIGHGGMATVYLAMDIELKSNWVLKEIRRAKNESKYEKALREARLMSEFKCRGIPIIVNIIEHESGQIAYIVMEYLPGKSLQDIMLERGSALPENFVIDAAIAVCDILNYLHTSDPPIIHRDIKPANIVYVESDNSFWLLDFGEAKKLTKETYRDEKATGTLEFMAPEQMSERMNGRQVSNQLSDIFSLGASIFYMVTGQISTQSTISKQYYSILDIDNTVSPTLSRIVSKAMEIMPTSRYHDVVEFKADLVECTEEVQKKRREAISNIRRTAFILAASVLMLLGGTAFRMADSARNDRSYDELIRSAQSASGDVSKKTQDALDAIELKPDNLEPYEALRTLYESDNVFTTEEEAKFQAVVTPNRDKLSEDKDYSEFAYNVGTMYLIYYTQPADSYIKAMDWFSSVKGSQEKSARVYLKIGEFDRDITKKLMTGNESGEFSKQWDSLNEALSLAKDQNNDLLLMAVCKKTISAMDEYCMKFKKDGITEEQMNDMLGEIKSAVAEFIPDSSEYKNLNGEPDFEKYYDSLMNEKEHSSNSDEMMNGTDALFLQIYPFFESVPIEIDKTYH